MNRAGWVALATAVLIGTAAASPSAAASWDWATGPATYDEEGKRDWSISISPYLWVANLNGDIALPPTGTIPISATFSNLATGLDGAFAGLLDVKLRRWHFISDNSWVRIKQKVAPDNPAFAAAQLEATTAFGTVAVSYELPLDWGTAIELYLGARWWFVENEALLSTAAFGVVGGGLSEAWADVAFGTRITHRITEKWRVTFIADIGGGSSELGWQVYGSTGYMFTPHVGMSAGYRILGVNYDNKGFSYDVKQAGLLLGFNFVY